jgi:outer membrane protein assembly factor BamB
VIVNQTIYIGSSSGTLFGLNASGQQIWSTQVGAAVPAPDEQNALLTTGLGAGDGLLVVPTESILVAYGNSTRANVPRKSGARVVNSTFWTAFRSGSPLLTN